MLKFDERPQSTHSSAVEHAPTPTGTLSGTPTGTETGTQTGTALVGSTREVEALYAQTRPARRPGRRCAPTDGAGLEREVPVRELSAQVLLSALHLVAWTDRGTTGRPQLALSTGTGWQQVSGDECWQLSRDLTGLATQHDLDGTTGTAAAVGDRLAELVHTALVDVAPLDALLILRELMLWLRYDTASACTELLDAMSCGPDGQPARVRLADVVAAFAGDAEEVMYGLTEQADELESLEDAIAERRRRPPSPT